MTATSAVHDSISGKHAAPKAGMGAPPLSVHVDTQFKNLAIQNIVFADSTPANVGMRVVAIGSDENARVGHTGTLVHIQLPSQLFIKWNHSGAIQASDRLKLIPEQKCPAGLVSDRQPLHHFICNLGAII